MNRGLQPINATPPPTSGTLASRPNAVNSGRRYLATDVSGGTEYIDTAVGTWTQAGAGAGGQFAAHGYNLNPTLFPKWRAALAKVRAGTADARVACIGDSTTEGANLSDASASSWPAQLSTLLGSYHAPSCYIINGNPSATDTRVTLGSGWTAGGLSVFAPGFTSASGAAGNLSVTFAHTFDTINVYYARNSGHGTVTVNVDGGSSLGSINANGSQAFLKAAFSCASGTHTINVTGATGGQVFLGIIEAVHSATHRTVVMNAGFHATTANGWSSSSGGLPSSAFISIGQAFTTWAPDLTIINLGINDAGVDGATAGSYSGYMQSITTAAKAVSDVLLVIPHIGNQAAYTLLLPQYRDKLYALAAANGVGLLDFQTRFAPYATSNTLGYYIDTVHLTAQGYADEAAAVLNFLTAIG